MKEEWLMAGAVVPVDVETTAALVAEIRRLIHVVGGMALAQASQEPVLWEMPDGKTADKWALQFYGGQKGKPLYTTPPQRKLTDAQERQNFEQWYAENAFDYASNPIGSRECGLQWNAWRARADHNIEKQT